MILTLILIAIGALLLLVIIYNILQQYRHQQAAEKRTLMLRHKNIINETDELLLNAGQLPFSKSLVLMLYQRILSSLQIMQQQDPKNAQIQTRIANIKQQIAASSEQSQNSANNLTPPESDRHAIQLLQLVKRLRTVLRIEHNKGKVNNQVLVNEDRRLELMRLKINLMNLIKRTTQALSNNDLHLAQQFLTKGIAVVDKVTDKDEQLTNIADKLQQKLEEISSSKQQIEQEQQARAEEKEKSELDVLFEPKRKW